MTAPTPHSSEFGILLKKVDALERKVDEILHVLQNDVTSECKKMGDHIDFIETVYDYIKSPLHFICDRFHGRQITMVAEGVRHSAGPSALSVTAINKPSIEMPRPPTWGKRFRFMVVSVVALSVGLVACGGHH